MRGIPGVQATPKASEGAFPILRSAMQPHQLSPALDSLELDDVAMTNNESSEANPDMLRAIIVDEEELLAEEAAGLISHQVEGLESFKLLFSGGIAGAVSKSATAPLARLTILYQVDGLGHVASPIQSSKASVAEMLARIVKQEGFRSLWKGNGVTIVHRLPYSSANFWTYEKVNEVWKAHLPSRGPLALEDVTRRLVAGGVAGLTACTLAYPLDLVRTRLAAQTTHTYYKGISHALSAIIRDEGMRGLYRGLGATLTQVAPSLAINYAAYETLRNHWLSKTNRSSPTVGMSLACGSLAGLVSSTATFPLDLVRRRLQLEGQRGSQQHVSYRNVFRNVVAQHGMKGLYAGLLPEYYKVVPGVAIAFCTYEFMKKSLQVQTNATSR